MARTLLWVCVCVHCFGHVTFAENEKRIEPTCSYLKSKNHLGRKTCYKPGP